MAEEDAGSVQLDRSGEYPGYVKPGLTGGDQAPGVTITSTEPV